jgi:hypothetical protein
MEPVDVERVRRAWEEAASDLAVRVQTQDCWLEGESGDRFELTAIVPDFGGRRGMAILPELDSTGSKLATARGYGFTVLGKSYEVYDRQLFEDTLNDWQWTGDGDPPPWYTGPPWSE